MPQSTTEFLGIRSLACRGCNVYRSPRPSHAISSSIWLAGRLADVFCHCLGLFCIISFIVETALFPFLSPSPPVYNFLLYFKLMASFFITSIKNICTYMYMHVTHTHTYISIIYIFLSKTYSVCII